MKKQKQWKVGELAKLTGLTVRTLHFYDQIGLFSPSGQTESGHRLYAEADLARLHQIVSLKELGFTLEEIKSVLAGGQVGPLDIVNLQMSRIQADIRKQQKRLEQLRYAAKLLQGNERLTGDDFAELLQAMQKDFEKPVIERQKSRERQLDILGSFFITNKATPKHEEDFS